MISIQDDSRFPIAPLERVLKAFAKYQIEAGKAEDHGGWGQYIPLRPKGEKDYDCDLEAYRTSKGIVVVDPAPVCAACRRYGIEPIDLYALVKDGPPEQLAAAAAGTPI